VSEDVVVVVLGHKLHQSGIHCAPALGRFLTPAIFKPPSLVAIVFEGL